MFKYQFVLVAFTALSATPGITLAADTAANTADPAASSCQVAQLAEIRTEFPQASQSRGEHGDVVVNVTIGKDGRAVRTHVTRSSGFPALDKAATDSITKHWRFAVAGCKPAELPTESLVTVQFQRAPQLTVSGTVNRHRSTPIAMNDQLPSHCDATSDTLGNQVVACAATAPVANDQQVTLAKRTDSEAHK